jgi:hypothetical protein
MHLSPTLYYVPTSPSPEPQQSPFGGDLESPSPEFQASDLPSVSECDSSTSTTLEDTFHKVDDTSTPNSVTLQVNSSEATLAAPERVETFEEFQTRIGRSTSFKSSLAPIQFPGTSDGVSSSASGPKPPPAHSFRTPVRTKRRSVSSNLSDPASPAAEKTPAPLPYQDFAFLLNTPAPIIFSTPLERNLLTSLSDLGFDTAQIVHSVLTDACDAAGAMWWMLKRKAEKKAKEAVDPEVTQKTADILSHSQPEGAPREDRKCTVSVQTDIVSVPLHILSATRSAPQLAFVPPTPTFSRPETPPPSHSPTKQLLSPSPAPMSTTRSQPATPSGSLRDKDGQKGRRDGKMRSGSVSIMQRATTALEAAGLVRKKSTEGVRDDKEKEREKDREKSKESERRIASGEESRSSHGSGSSKLAKSAHSKASRDNVLPSTPPPEPQHSQSQMGSPWVMTEAQHSPPHVPAPTPANTPGESRHTPSSTQDAPKAGGTRHRASLLTTFRLWFNDERKGKRKDPNISTPAGTLWSPAHNRVNTGNGSVKRRTSGNTGNFASRRVSHKAQRPSVSSHRSSSANSRRSSAASAQIILLDPPHVIEQVPNRRSIGTHTPNSERGDFSSRPSSVQSISMPRHRKSPSASSAGSAHFRTASPMQKYHKRTGSGSSTRVVRQTQATHNSSTRHTRSNSASSSLHTPTSSRPASYYEPSESDAPRNVSPFRNPARRSLDDNRRSSHGSSTTFVAQKKQAPFMSPGGHFHGNSIGRSSWKKSWGLEPPGWQSRTTHLPIEVLAISSPTDGVIGIRDVFSGRQSLNLGDESDWVDEDDDIPAFAGGLGQMAASASSNSSALTHIVTEPIVQLSPPPTGRRGVKRGGRNPGVVPAINTSRQKSAHSPVERASPVPAENNYEASELRGGRRQLPPGRSGPAFRHAIQEEDEGEEE